MTGLGAMMAGGNPLDARGRQQNDKYPTPEAVTRALVRRYEHLRSYEIWEPCAGDGAMTRVLSEASPWVVGSDIVPGAEGIVEADFLTCDPPATLGQFARYGRVDAIITNPPFNLAPQMIERALSFNPLFVAFVLKSTFWQAARRWPLFKKHQPSAIHPLLWRPDFLGLGAPTMDVVWCVWDRMSSFQTTIYEPMQRPS